MAYTTPPTFVDDTILTAAQMRALSTAIAELQSAGEQPPQVWLQLGTDSTSGATFGVRMRHAHRYLWWRVDFGSAGDGDDIQLNIYPESGGGPINLYDDTSAGNASYALVEDLNGLLDDGEFYRIDMYIKVNAGGDANWVYCEERSTAT